MNYTSFVSDVANMIVVPITDPAYQQAVPNIITDAEQRLYRELDLLSTVVRQTGLLTAGSRNFTLPTGSGTFVVVEQMNAITPQGTTNPDLGTRVPMLPVTKEYLDSVYPSSSGAGVPVLLAPISQQDWILGPWPDAAYTVEVVGTIRPAPLSETNPNTFLTDNLPDVFMAAALVFAAGYQGNFSSMGDNPAQAMSWESHVKPLIDSAKGEELRKKFQSNAWSSKAPSPIATPPRV